MWLRGVWDGGWEMVKRLGFALINGFPPPSTFKGTSPMNLLESHAWVCELINCDRGEWKAEVVKSLFIPHEAETILGFPISSALLEDSVIWNASPNSKFSARSTYELAMNLCEQSERGCISNDGVIKKFWRKIWSLQVPNKVKHFAWRACKISSLVFLTLRREVFWWMIGVSNVVRRGSLRVNCFGAVVLLLKCGSYLLYLSLA